MKKILLSLLFSLATLVAMAQSMSVASFRYDEKDLTANSAGTMKYDQNGDKCALIRIQTTEKGFAFDVGVLGVTDVDDKHVGEVWVYVPRGVKMITIRHAQLGTLERYAFPVSIQEGRTYVMHLTTAKVTTIVEQDDGLTYFTLSVVPSNAVVMVDGELKSLDADGSLILRLPRGEHSYSIQAPGYASQSSTFTLGTEKVTKDIRLESVMASLSISCETPGAAIYVNDQLKTSNSQWTGSLNAGSYLVEARKEGYYSAKQSVSLAQKESKSVSIPALTARTGNIDVSYKPVNCEVWVDGIKLGTSPDVFKGVMVGSRKVTLKKEGYVDKVVTVEVKEGETVAVNGVLEKKASGGTVEAGAGVASSTTSVTQLGGPIEYDVNGVKFVMVPVEGGTFMMGATAEQGSDAESDEKPSHSVTLSSYYIGQTEVTQELWTAVMGKNPSGFKGDNLPVETVSWKDCQEFIAQINKITGKRFRLPTEAEWEYAARGGNKSRGYKYSGSNNIDDVAWYKNNSNSKTHLVGTKTPNELGIYDMSGNVYEWCQDWYGAYSSSAQTNPKGAASGSGRVGRGGSWNYSARGCRSSDRHNFTPSIKYLTLGLRLVSE